MNSKEISNIVRLWKEIEKDGTPSVLATLVQVSGSHYRRPGARMLITGDGRTAGSISGGCLESDLRERAFRIMKSRDAELVRYDTTTDEDLLLGTGMGCGGIVDLLLESTGSDSVVKFMRHLVLCWQHRQRMGVATIYRVLNCCDMQVGDKLFYNFENTPTTTFGNVELRERVIADLEMVMSSGKPSHKSYPVATGIAEVFLECTRPPVSLLLLGAGDDAVPIVGMAKSLGWQVTLVDHRNEFLQSGRFPEADRLVSAHTENLNESISIDSFDAAVIMTHNYFRDRELLRKLLGSKLKYFGLLGASKRAERMLDDLRMDGIKMTNQQLARLRAPVGLDLAAEGPHEIALSILSEIQCALAGGTGRSLRDLQGKL